MYVAKHTMLYKHKVHDGQRGGLLHGHPRRAERATTSSAAGRSRRTADYVRGRVSRIFRDGDTLKVWGFDTLSGEPVVIDADMVVLATAMRPNDGVEELAQKLSCCVDADGFINEAHPKLRPVETNTAGVFVAGACQAPRDIPDSVAMASAAAPKVLRSSVNELEREPPWRWSNEATCIGCFHCERVCPYGAVERREVKDGKVVRLNTVAYVNHGVCQGCGTCQATCLSKRVELQGLHRRADLGGDQRAGASPGSARSPRACRGARPQPPN